MWVYLYTCGEREIWSFKRNQNFQWSSAMSCNKSPNFSDPTQKKFCCSCEHPTQVLLAGGQFSKGPRLLPYCGSIHILQGIRILCIQQADEENKRKEKAHTCYFLTPTSRKWYSSILLISHCQGSMPRTSAWKRSRETQSRFGDHLATYINIINRKKHMPRINAEVENYLLFWANQWMIWFSLWSLKSHVCSTLL